MTDTPETDDLARGNHVVPTEFAEQLERKRDEWKAKYLQQNKDLGYELRDPNGTIWSECKRLQIELTAVTEQRDRLAKACDQYSEDEILCKLQEITEQRDRLAEALRECREDSIELLGERDWWQNESRLDYQKRYQETRDNVTRADEALKSLTPNEL